MAAVYQALIPEETLQILHWALVYQPIAERLMNMSCNGRFPWDKRRQNNDQ
jgi:hypothetical protein